MLLDLIQAAAFVESGAQPTSSHPTSSEPQPRSWLAAAGRARGSHQRRLLCVPVPVLNADDVFSASAASSASATMAISPALARKAFGDIYGGKAFPRRRWRRVSTDGQPQGVDPEVLASALQTAVGTAVGDGAGAGEDVFCMELMGDDGPQDQDDEDEEDGSEARFVSDQQGCIEKQRFVFGVVGGGGGVQYDFLLTHASALLVGQASLHERVLCAIARLGAGPRRHQGLKRKHSARRSQSSQGEGGEGRI